jgi:hypothetical protein
VVFVTFQFGNQLELWKLFIFMLHFLIRRLLAERRDEDGTRARFYSGVNDNLQVVDEN